MLVQQNRTTWKLGTLKHYYLDKFNQTGVFICHKQGMRNSIAIEDRREDSLPNNWPRLPTTNTMSVIIPWLFWKEIKCCAWLAYLEIIVVPSLWIDTAWQVRFWYPWSTPWCMHHSCISPTSTSYSPWHQFHSHVLSITPCIGYVKLLRDTFNGNLQPQPWHHNTISLAVP